jgi:hypothetical protein
MPPRVFRLLLALLVFVGSAAFSQGKTSAPKSEAPKKPGVNLTEKMNNIIIPKVQFQGATIGEALEYLRTKSREMDTSSGPPGVKGVNIILRSGTNEPLPPVISLDLKDVPLSEALRYVTELAGMKFKVEDDAVLVVPLADDISEKHTRTFKVPPDFLFTSRHGPDAPPPPPQPIGLPPLELPRPSSSKLILEAQGVTFPEGASATFNPLTGLLTVTNTQPNLDLVAAFAEVLRKDAPATIAHQLIILEGPGELIRQANAAASRTTNAAAELTTLLANTKNPGSNVRVIADAFLETKSGTHSTTTAVREHVSNPDLDFDKKSRPSIAWEMRPLGLTLEVEPTLEADDPTIENSLFIKFHPVSPRARQMRVTDPLTSRDAEFPFSITAGAEFKTSLTCTDGATKLIGVTKPVGLADQKADVLWAAFLTSSIRRVEALPQSPPLPETSPSPGGMIAAIFHAAPGLLESLMESTSQPLREWLEKEQGITFPAGAVLEQKGEHLHVTNTPAMIEPIGALIAHAEAIAPKTVAFTLHTIEAPAALLRDLVRQSTAAGADDTAMFTTVETSTTRGEARFIDSLFLETQPGTRASHESVREHVFISEFAITDKNQPEITFEMRRVGSIIEVEPAISADGHTVELNFSHEIHSAPPETRGAHFRDPASSKPFAMPATDFHVLKTSSGLSITKGSTKLVSLHKPTGRDAEGKLWATFLKCDVVPQVAKRRFNQTKSEIEALQIDNTSPGRQQTRSFRVNPAHMAEAMGEDPVTGQRRKDVKQLFEEAGITFPDGASNHYAVTSSLLVTRNTLENLRKIELFLADIEARHWSPGNVVLTTHVLQAPGPLLRRLTAQAAGKSNHRAELDELLAAVKIGSVQSLGTNRIETKSGVRATTQQGAEHATLADVRISKEGVPEIITETRNVGFKVELEAIVGADGQLVDINIAPEFHTAEPLEHREHILDTQGRRLEFPLADYHVAKVTTGITMHSGTARLLSLYKPTGKPEFEKEDILQAIFITCDLLRVGE